MAQEMAQAWWQAVVVQTVAAVLAALIIGATVIVVPSVRAYLFTKVLVSRWLIMVLILVPVCLLVHRVRRLLSGRATVYQYTKDEFFGVTWRWRYEFNMNRFSPKDFGCFCPTCDSDRVVRKYRRSLEETTTEFVCQTCNKVVARVPLRVRQILEEVGLQVRRKLRTGECRDVVLSYAGDEKDAPADWTKVGQKDEW